ncbi:tetratricopeptide repeat protein [Corallococcus silvisoli]|uniref:tetratricopeptide repeat protein n=1 Tax=Corallococcus silvisoli TaxID=2697031 RepID=UPI001377EE5A|nr:tetratricopeptide repeat protein [Corallococcus silvisoli]NBD12057.1 tetratricopeptide repeat protein [Corallococcus silvisoli]
MSPAAAPTAAALPGRALRVRVYADADHRARVLHWERGFAAWLQRASEAVREPLGVTFELESARAWDRRGSNGPLEPVVDALEAADAGEDVDLVVGLVAAPPAFSDSQHELGFARVLGRHCVLRGIDAGLPVEARQRLEVSALLHEWAHTWGAPHVRDGRGWMSPKYDAAHEGFDARTLALLDAGRRHLPGARVELAAQKAWARELRAAVEGMSGPAWEGPERDFLLEWTDRVRAASVVLGPEGTPRSLTPLERQRLAEVIALEKAGRVEVAAEVMEPLAVRHPHDERVQLLACYLAVRLTPGAEATRQRCERAAARFPSEPSLRMNVALLHLHAGRFDEARDSLLAARRNLEARTDVEPVQWADLAGLFLRAHCVTWAEQTANRAPGLAASSAVLEQAALLRRQVALRPHGDAPPTVDPMREGFLVRSVIDIEALLHAGASGPARERITALAREFPETPSVMLVQCELHLLQGRLGAARTACERVLAFREDAVQAHLLLGVLATNTRAHARARAHLERVIALEPSRTEAWHLLAREYRGTRLLRPLQTRYREQFARDLP